MDVDEFLDKDGYPTEHALDVISRFNGTPRELIDFIDSLWWPSGGHTTFTHVDKTPDGKPGYCWYLGTGGWSGNEDIIATLEKTSFWFAFWHSSVRGGGFTFYLREPTVRKVGFWGNPMLYRREEPDG